MKQGIASLRINFTAAEKAEDIKKILFNIFLKTDFELIGIQKDQFLIVRREK